jgi:hypothetical protein
MTVKILTTQTTNSELKQAVYKSSSYSENTAWVLNTGVSYTQGDLYICYGLGKASQLEKRSGQVVLGFENIP